MKKRYHFLLIFVLLCTSQNILGQIKFSTFSSVEREMKVTPKPLILFIHTDWCVYCKNMENTTFKNEDVIQNLNQNFYFVSFNAESRESVSFLDHTFHFQPNGNKTGIHQLAKELATINGQISYPTLTILNSKYEIIFQKKSFISSKELLKILHKTPKNDA